MARFHTGSAQWRKVRREVLARDGYACQLRRPGCTGRADQVDHITPRSKGGAWYDPVNLRAACAFCNSSRRDGRPPGPDTTIRPSREW